MNERRELVTVQSRVDQKTPAGGTTSTWATVGTLYAQVVAKQGRQTAHGETQTSRIAYEVTGLAEEIAMVTAGHRLLLEDGTVLMVTAVPPADGRPFYRRVLAEVDGNA